MLPLLDAAQARSVVEIGALQGHFTEVLLDWADERGARVIAVDPTPARELEALARRRPELELVRERSQDALARLEPPGAVVVDGDHNYFTVSTELRLVSERVPQAPLPLLICHDVLWPHGRRDDYFVPEAIPPEHRQPILKDGRLFPENPGVARGGFPLRWPAEREGGPRNGVLTAVEDFVAERPGTRLAVIPAFFGIGVVWSEEAPWSGAVARLVEPWDGNPVLMRLERNRVLHLASELEHRDRLARLERLLRLLRNSRALALADRVGRTRPGGAFRWRERIADVLDGDDAEG